MSRSVTVDQSELDALRAVANAARHLTAEPLAYATSARHASVCLGDMMRHARRQEEAWARLVEALGEVSQ